MNVSINENQIRNVFGDKCIVIPYKKLYQITSLDSQLSRTPYIFILYEYEPNYGHWTLLFKQGSKRVEFFDSYGTLPDSIQKKFPKKLRNEYGYQHKEVVDLMLNSKLNKEYNNYKLQSKNRSVKTCGRWCILRALASDVYIDDFAKMFLFKRLSPDQLVVKATKSILGI